MKVSDAEFWSELRKNKDFANYLEEVLRAIKNQKDEDEASTD